jgi:hypothetical protein
MTTDPRDPIDATVECRPETGAIKPYELWLHYQSGNKRCQSSYKTQAAADMAAAKVLERIKRGQCQ